MTMPEIPPRMRKFPLFRGRFPIHFTVFVNSEGQPEFKVVARARQVEAINKNLCHLCGERMVPPYWFIGGPNCAAHHNFLDGPMHEDCARYACTACPFLANPQARYGLIENANSERSIVHNAEAAGTLRPAKMFLGATMTYKAVHEEEKTVVLMTRQGNRVAKMMIPIQHPTFHPGEWVVEDWTAIPQRKE